MKAALLYGALLGSFCCVLEAASRLASRLANIEDREFAAILAGLGVIAALSSAFWLRPHLTELDPFAAACGLVFLVIIASFNHWRWRRRVARRNP